MIRKPATEAEVKAVEAGAAGVMGAAGVTDRVGAAAAVAAAAAAARAGAEVQARLAAGADGRHCHPCQASHSQCRSRCQHHRYSRQCRSRCQHHRYSRHRWQSRTRQAVTVVVMLEAEEAAAAAAVAAVAVVKAEEAVAAGAVAAGRWEAADLGESLGWVAVHVVMRPALWAASSEEAVLVVV